MSVCEVCGGVTADHGRHLKWHRTMSNIPPKPDPVADTVRLVYGFDLADVPLADIRGCYNHRGTPTKRETP